MGRRVTIKDIATEAGVSTGTVHRALYGKKGVSEEMRTQIMELCKKRGYQANSVASALKRGPLRIVGAFPVPEGKGRFFYSKVWQGFRRCMEEIKDYNIEVVELLYYEGNSHEQSVELASCYERYQGEIDALVTVGHFNAAGKEAVRLYTDHDIPVFLACDDTRDCGRVACVQANHEMTGRMVAELLSSQLQPGGAVLLCGGDVLIPSHAQTVAGFEAYLRENQVDLQVRKLYGYHNEQDLVARLRQELAEGQHLAGAFSVSARLSVLLADEVVAAKAEHVRVVASDLFDETIRNMERGIVKNILYKDPEQQAYLASRMLSDYLLKGQKPIRDIHYVESRIIFRSSLDMYR